MSQVVVFWAENMPFWHPSFYIFISILIAKVMYLKIWNSIHLTAAVRDYMPNFETIWLHSKGEKGFFSVKN